MLLADRTILILSTLAMWVVLAFFSMTACSPTSTQNAYYPTQTTPGSPGEGQLWAAYQRLYGLAVLTAKQKGGGTDEYCRQQL